MHVAAGDGCDGFFGSWGDGRSRRGLNGGRYCGAEHQQGQLFSKHGDICQNVNIVKLKIASELTARAARDQVGNKVLALTLVKEAELNLLQASNSNNS